MGIGLVLCKCIVDSYGGKIWVESEFDQGSIFYFFICKFQEKFNCSFFFCGSKKSIYENNYFLMYWFILVK